MLEDDALIVGGGHNGLVCGTYLAKAGLRVRVLERGAQVGGAAVTEEFHPGFRASTFSYLMSLLHPKIIRELDLRSHGLEVLPCSDMFSPLEGDDYIVFSADPARTKEQFARFNKKDADAYADFDRHLQEAAAVVRRLLFETPPDPSCLTFKGLKELAGFAWRYRKIGSGFYRIIDLMTMSVDDYLRRWFQDSRIRAVLAYYASIGTFLGPRSPGSAYVLMHHVMGEHEGAGGWGFIRGGMGSITRAIADSGRKAGLQVEVDAEVGRILVQDGRATGVELRDGRKFRAKIVASNAAAPVTFLKLVEESELPPDFIWQVRRYRTRSAAFKINIACDRLPEYGGLDKARADGALGDFDYPTYVHVAPDVEYLERAYDEAKYGWYSSQPFITPVSPTVVDDSLAPSGKHVLNLFGGHASCELSKSSWDAERDNLRDTVFSAIDRFAPGFSDGVIAAQVLVPPDIEQRLSIPNGHIFHGELQADQLFFKRPVQGYADYRSPIGGLYQCGSSAHPGGGVSGIPGHNAAREILRDLGRKFI